MMTANKEGLVSNADSSNQMYGSAFFGSAFFGSWFCICWVLRFENSKSYDDVNSSLPARRVSLPAPQVTIWARPPTRVPPPVVRVPPAIPPSPPVVTPITRTIASSVTHERSVDVCGQSAARSEMQNQALGIVGDRDQNMHGCSALLPRKML